MIKKLWDMTPEEQTEEICMKAVKTTGYTIQYIHNPSEAVQLEAVKENGFVIQYIYNPSEEVCIKALLQNKALYRYIKKEYRTDVVKLFMEI